MTSYDTDYIYHIKENILKVKQQHKDIFVLRLTFEELKEELYEDVDEYHLFIPTLFKLLKEVVKFINSSLTDEIYEQLYELKKDIINTMTLRRSMDC